MPFERFVPPQPSGAQPKATIRPSGLISFDAAAVAAFGLEKPSHAVLFFDKSRKLVGIRAISSGKEEGAIKLSKRRRSVSLKAPGFFAQYAISFDRPQRFDVGSDPGNDMLTISLKTVQRRRGRRPKAQK